MAEKEVDERAEAQRRRQEAVAELQGRREGSEMSLTPGEVSRFTSRERRARRVDVSGEPGAGFQ